MATSRKPDKTIHGISTSTGGDVDYSHFIFTRVKPIVIQPPDDAEAATIPVKVISSSKTKTAQSKNTRGKSVPTHPRQARSSVLHRSVRKKLTVKPARKARRKLRVHKQVKRMVLAPAALLLTAGLVGAALHQSGTNLPETINQATNVLGKHVTISSGEEKEIDRETFIARGLANPVRLMIPKFEASAGIEINRPINTLPVPKPSRLSMISWVDESALPGENGVIHMSGFIGSSEHPGALKSIGTLKTGDEIQIRRGDGTIISYYAKRIEKLDNNGLKTLAQRLAANTDRPYLNLVAYANDGKSHIIVFALQQ